MSNDERRGVRHQGAVDDAGRWLSVLRGHPTQDDLADFAAWKREDRLHAESFEAVSRNWERDRFLASTQMGRGRDLSLARAWHRQPITRYAAAAAFLAIAGTSIVLLIRPPSEAIAATYTSGEIARAVVLRDGSTLTLARHSQVTANIAPGQRRAEVERGKVRLDIRSIANTPFVIHVKGSTFQANGGSLVIDTNGPRVRVTTLHGTIADKDDGDTSMIVLNEERRPVGTIELPFQRSLVNPTASGERPSMIIFDATPLADAVRAFNARHGATIEIASSRIAALKVTGGFRTDDPRGFAAAVAAMFALDLVRNSSGSLRLQETERKR